MGGSTVIIENISSSKIFPENINLYLKDISRTISQLGGNIDLDIISKTLARNQQFLFNEKVFDRFGVSYSSSITTKVYADEAILDYIKNNIDSDATTFVNKFISKSYRQKAIDWVNDNDYSFVSGDPTSTKDEYNYHGTTFTHNDTVSRFKIGSDTYVFVTDSDGHIIIQDNNDIRQAKVHIYKNDGSEEEKFINVSKDTRRIWVVFYEDNNGNQKSCFVRREDVQYAIKVHNVFVLPLKKDGNWVGDDKYNNFLLNRFGLAAKDKDGNSLKKSLSDSHIKNAFITYAATDRNGKYKEILDEIYGENNDNIVQINAFVKIYYNKTDDDKYGIEIAGVGEYTPIPKRNSDGDKIGISPTWIIPADMLNVKGTKAKYEAYSDLFSIFAQTTQKYHLKWYQTGFFKFLISIISIGLAWATGGASLALITTGVIVASFVLGQIAPEISIIANIIQTILTFNPASAFSSIKNIIETAENIFEIGSKLYSYVINGEVEEMAKALSEKEEDIEKMRKQLEEQREHEGLYIKYDANELIDIGYDMMYNPYNYLYDYDKFFNLGD